MTDALSAPPFPSERDVIAMVSVSGPSDRDALVRGLWWLADRFTVREDERAFASSGYLAGDDALRSAALLDAVRDPAVRAVVCARGGYGAMRVLERVGAEVYEALVRDPKPLLGFSDVTALHALWARAGLRSLHGTMPATVGRALVDPAHALEAVDALAGKFPDPWRWEGLRVVCEGEARGRAAGGNLSLLAALQGTPGAYDLDGAVLFLEDVGERPYRVDRMLTQLRWGGSLAKVRGVVLGEFVDCAVGRDGVQLDAVLHAALAPLGVPVFAGAAFGHGRAQRVVPLGAAVTMSDGAVTFHW